MNDSRSMVLTCLKFAVGSTLVMAALPVLYWGIGITLIAPRKEVRNICQAISPGMSLEQVKAMIEAHRNSLEGNNSYVGIYIQTADYMSIYKTASEWECFCSVFLEDDGSGTVRVKTTKPSGCSATA